ncbi:chemotaxis protein CheC [Fictibacillus sp. KIGAM418]|uniref:Chemotaxis protein CheC n=1 Tax=Fictibacillus marinisediminis TaxID=2878389 RepID=A0A9X2BCL5_9BACL|nr:chemotaxis protein CheC [Fictibacillus marinisediminis]MCK6257034.1 chemotaxis protein CheC [Fictibacillus marinisediminis]
MAGYARLTGFHLDVLREVGNIGAGHAATALSELLGKTVDMRVPSVNIVSLQEMTELLGGTETVVAAVYLRMLGDAPGSMFFMLPLNQSKKLVSHMLAGEPYDPAEGVYSELTLSALQEAGNILSGSYLSALSDLTGMNIQPSVPSLSIDMAGAILGYGLIEISKSSDYAIIINTSLTEPENMHSDSIHGYFFLLPDPDSFEKIFDALGVPLHE